MKIRKSKTLFALGLFLSFWTLTINNLCYPVSVLAAKVTLRAGTPVILALKESINSNTKALGDSINFEVARDVEVEGNIIIKKGTPVIGEVISVDKSGYFGTSGKIDVAIKEVAAVDGKTVLLRGTVEREGKSKVATSILLFIICWPTVFFTKGNAAYYPAGSEAKAYVDMDIDISIK
jgi:hypothetical protein